MIEDYGNFREELNSLLDENESVEYAPEEIQQEEKNIRDREEILSIQDPSEIGLEEYEVFLNYSTANIYNILRTQIKTKIPDKVTIEEMAKEAISLAIYTYDISKAEEKNSTFRTHLGWKAKQVVTDYARAFKKATQNKLNTEDESFKKTLEDNVLQADISGDAIVDSDLDVPEDQRTEKQAIEQMKKIEWAMRQVRYELPRENNLILDVGIGEIKKVDGSSFSLTEWSQYTGQKENIVRKIFKSSKRLLKQKLYRKGFMEIIVDQEKTSEDLVKDTNITEQIQAREEDENIIESADIQEIYDDAEELLSGLEDVDELLKD